MEERQQIEAAYQEYEARQDRRKHPEGTFDKAGRWYPTEAEHQDCCNGVRNPSRSHPYSRMTHCRSIPHVAAVFGVDPKELRKCARQHRPPNREGGELYYKMVARLEDGRLVSIYNGRTEYVLGQTLIEQARKEHGGGYYVYNSPQAARWAVLPTNSRVRNAPQVLLRLRAEGNYVRYDNGKLAFSRVTPLEIIEEEGVVCHSN
jgi:hypothetical protein